MWSIAITRDAQLATAWGGTANGTFRSINVREGLMARQDYTGSVVYFIGAHRGLVKIGVARDVYSRLRALQTGSGVHLTLLATIPGSYALERHYHGMFSYCRRHGEWFERAPELMAEIRRLKKLDLPPYESASMRAEKAKLRNEWQAAVEKRNRSTASK